EVPPHLYDFLWAQAAGGGVDLTRLTDIGEQNSSSNYSNVAHLQAEPFGEMGMVTQKDHGLWQDQTGGPTDPPPGNVPRGKRDLLRTPHLNDGEKNSLALDSGAGGGQDGALSAAAAWRGQDAAAFFYLDQSLPVYFEIAAKVKIVKPTSGWKGNAYLIFDYQSPTDFKFAGLDASINKLVMGHRDA